MAWTGLVGLGLVTAAVGCGGEVVTTLPSSDPVATNAAQFCSDTASYLTSLVPSIIPLICESAVTEMSGAECQTEFDTCVSEASSEAQGIDLGSMVIPNCESSLAQCKVDIGPLSQCISDFGSALTAAASGISSQTACSGSTSTQDNPFTHIAIPASCKSLPSGCGIVSSSVSVMGSSTPPKG
jgi:hypothetical protein